MAVTSPLTLLLTPPAYSVSLQEGVKEAKVLLAEAEAKLARLEKLYANHMKRT